ncbi:MAG: protein translocase subunit SecF [Chloroflexi bacterium]|nr:protein translocase subunit SecF [Chloroflexota bacterium]
MSDIVGKRKWFFLLSALIIVPGLVFLLLGPLTGGAAGLQFSIDYTGGTKWEIRFEDEAVTPAQVKAVLAAEGLEDATVQTSSDGYILIRTEPLGLAQAPSPTPVPSAAPSISPSPATSASPAASATAPASTSPSSTPAASASTAPSAATSPSPVASGSPSPSATPAASPTPTPTASPSASPATSPVASPGASPAASPAPTPVPGGVTRTGEIGALVTALEADLGPIESERLLTTVGPVISSELTAQALLLVAVGSLGILVWMTIRFRDFRFGATALVALVHDVLVVLGIFAILGTLFGVEVDGLFVTAMLTLIGFSVHDTIVVYDRIRENRSRHAGERFTAIVNYSILQTLARSINTSVVVILTLVALLLFAGPSIRYFVLALLIGIIAGTYSSIFIASPLLTIWEEWEARRRSRAGTGRPARRATA